MVKAIWLMYAAAGIFLAAIAAGFSGCPSSNGQVPQFDPRGIFPGQRMPEAAKATLISRYSAGQDVWGFKSGTRFYRVETWQDTISYMVSGMEEW